MSTLKVNKLRDTAGSADAITLDPNGGAVLAGVTTMTTARVTSGIVTNTFIVGAGVTISESGIEASGIGITCASINGDQIGGRRNVVINGGMQIYQRGSTSFAHDGTTSAYTLDRFVFAISNTDEYDCTVTQDSSVPDGQGFSKSYKVTTGTAESAVGADERYEVQCKIEGQDLQHFVYGSSAARTITLSFWVKCSVAGTYAFTIYRSETAGSRVINKPYTINSANTWEKKIITIAGDTVRSIDNNAGTTASTWRMVWGLSAGSNWTSDTASTWAAYGTTYYLGGHVTNTFATTAGSTWYMTGVQLEVGSQATPFEHRSYGEEELLCHRYFFSGTANRFWYNGHGGNVTDYQLIPFKTEMRAAPTITFGTIHTSTNVNTSSGSDSGHFYSDVKKSSWQYSPLSAATGNTTGKVDYTASAEL